MRKVLYTASVERHLEVFHRPYLRWWRDLGWEVHSATSDGEGLPESSFHHRIAFTRSPFALDTIRAYRSLAKLVHDEHFDVIHAHTPVASVITRLAARRSRRNGTVVIYTAHGFHFHRGGPKASWAIYYPLEKLLSRVTDYLITINDEDYLLAQAKFASTVRRVDGVGVAEEVFSTPLPADQVKQKRTDLGLSKECFVLIYTAELNDNKNQVQAIEAVKMLVSRRRDVGLLLVGDGRNYEYLRDKVSRLNLDRNVIFLGYRNDVADLLKISDAAISTSKREGLPVNLMEAQMTGLPIVATDVRGNRDVVEDGVNGRLISVGSAHQLAEAIEGLISDREAAARYGFAARSRARRWSSRVVEDQLFSVYNEIVETRDWVEHG